MDRLKRLPTYGVYALLIYMPFHIFLSQSLSLRTGGLDEWKVAKDVVLMLLTAVTVLLVWYQRKDTKIFNWLVAVSVLYLLIHLGVWSLNSHIDKQTAALGTVYNNRLLWYLLSAFGAVLLWPKGLQQQTIIKVVIGVSTVVSVLGVLQYFLPKEILTHVGYSVARGVKPAFFIDDKPNLPRIMSTLRDPNSLGAYLILPSCLLFDLILRNRRRTLACGLLLLNILAIFLTFSRGAWVGLAIALGSLFVFRRGWIKKLPSPKVMLVGLLAVVIVGAIGYAVHNGYVVQNVVVHADSSTKAKEDSNRLHINFAITGLKDIAKKPFGHGPGTAGIVSIHDTGGGQLTEDYYIQIGYEVGILGLLVYVGILGYLFMDLRTHPEPLALALLASLVAYLFMSLIMHLWSNEADAAQWWLLTGVVLASKPKRRA